MGAGGRRGGVARPAQPYDMRSTYASNQLAAGVELFIPARIMGTSTEMLERHYGTLLTGSIAACQAPFEAGQDRDASGPS